MENYYNNMKLKCITNSAVQTKKFGKILAEQILKEKLEKRAIIIGLIGELGTGKTTFLQGFSKGLGIRNRILSPTFVILKRFKIKNSRFNNFYHIDAFRIEKLREILSLNFSEIIQNPKNIITIEWADKILKALPKESFIIKFDFLGPRKRMIEIFKYPYVDK